MNKIPDSITITVSYDSILQKITGVSSESVIVSENCVFIFLLQSIFESHPDIEKTYPPGELGLLLNNQRPGEWDILKEGDIVSLGVVPLNGRRFDN